jgi:hypothetical protein
MTTSDNLEFFKALVGVVETYGGAFGNNPGLIRAQLITLGVTGANLFAPEPAILKASMTTCREQYLSAMVLQGSDNSQYYQLKTDLANDMTKGTDIYPNTLVDTMRLIMDYKVLPLVVNSAETAPLAGGSGIGIATSNPGIPQIPVGFLLKKQNQNFRFRNSGTLCTLDLV